MPIVRQMLNKVLANLTTQKCFFKDMRAISLKYNHQGKRLVSVFLKEDSPNFSCQLTPNHKIYLQL